MHRVCLSASPGAQRPALPLHRSTARATQGLCPRPSTLSAPSAQLGTTCSDVQNYPRRAPLDETAGPCETASQISAPKRPATLHQSPHDEIAPSLGVQRLEHSLAQLRTSERGPNFAAGVGMLAPFELISRSTTHHGGVPSRTARADDGDYGPAIWSASTSGRTPSRSAIRQTPCHTPLARPVEGSNKAHSSPVRHVCSGIPS